MNDKTNNTTYMKKLPRFSLATALLVGIGAALAIAQTNHPVTNGACCASLTDPAMLASVVTTNAPATPPEKKPLPKLLDLGASKCIPCKMMATVLEELKKEYAGKLEVEFIDVWKNPNAGKQYGIEIIPTQIFFDAGGKELFRHVGFFAKEDILAKWKELGVDLAEK
jgi:thioredoxin 1